MRSFAWSATLISLLTGAWLVTAAAPADAVDYEPTGRERVVDELHHETFRVRLADGATARGDVLRFPARAEHLTLRPRLAQGVLAGLQALSSMAADETSRGAAAGTNGGYWLSWPTGVPNGLYVEQGRMLAGEARLGQSGNRRPRSSMGITADGGVLMDLMGVDVALTGPDGGTVEVDDVNRAARVDDGTTRRDDWYADGEVLLYDSRYGRDVDVPGDAAVAEVEQLDLPPGGEFTGVVLDRYGTPPDGETIAVPDGRSLLIAHGTAAERLASFDTQAAFTGTVTLRPGAGDAQSWQAVRDALPGGPLMLRAGQRTSEAEWALEAFSPRHRNDRQPRTAVARTGDDELLLVTVDGRRPSHSVGLTLAELQGLLVDLGAVDGLNLDGGGSTATTVGGSVRNIPSESGRSVANGLFVYLDAGPGARDITVHGCPVGVIPDSPFADGAATNFADAIACIVFYELTFGVSDDAYGPFEDVTRGQMASFLARWIDGAEGTPLPAGPPEAFDDVSRSSTHAHDIDRLAAAGIVAGGTDGRYRPREPVSRAQMASFVARAYDYAAPSSLPSSRDLFVDDTRFTSHEDDINRLAGAGIVQGRSRLHYNPSAEVSRAEMAAFLARLSDVGVEEGLVPPPS